MSRPRSPEYSRGSQVHYSSWCHNGGRLVLRHRRPLMQPYPDVYLHRLSGSASRRQRQPHHHQVRARSRIRRRHRLAHSNILLSRASLSPSASAPRRSDGRVDLCVPGSAVLSLFAPFRSIHILTTYRVPFQGSFLKLLTPLSEMEASEPGGTTHPHLCLTELIMFLSREYNRERGHR